MTPVTPSKRCPTCCAAGGTLPASAFFQNPARRDGLSSQCRACHHDVQRRYYDRNADSERLRARRRTKSVRRVTRELVLRYLQGHPCVDCGEHDPVVLEFHHVRDTKRDNVGSLVCDGYEWPIVYAEIAKCVVLCAKLPSPSNGGDSGGLPRAPLDVAVRSRARWECRGFTQGGESHCCRLGFDIGLWERAGAAGAVRELPIIGA
jgi:hypothetical protein